MDMARGIELELHEQLKDEPPLVETSIKLLGKAFEYGALDHDVSWFNDDDNFAQVMQETLYLQRLLLQEVRVANTWPPTSTSPRLASTK